MPKRFSMTEVPRLNHCNGGAFDDDDDDNVHASAVTVTLLVWLFCGARIIPREGKSDSAWARYSHGQMVYRSSSVPFALRTGMILTCAVYRICFGFSHLDVFLSQPVFVNTDRISEK